MTPASFKRWQIYFHSCLLRDSKFARDNSIIQTLPATSASLPAPVRSLPKTRLRHMTGKLLQRRGAVHHAVWCRLPSAPAPRVHPYTPLAPEAPVMRTLSDQRVNLGFS